MKGRIVLACSALIFLSISCTLFPGVIGVSEAHIILAPDTSDPVSAEMLADAREMLQTRMDGITLSGRAMVSVENELIRIDLTNREDIEPVLDICGTQGILILFDSNEPLSEGSSVPENPTVILSDQDIRAAHVLQDSLGQYMVALAFTENGGKRLAEYTKDNVGRFLVIALDGVVISSPRVQSEVSGGEAVVQGDFSKESANRFASLLRSGRLPFPLKILEVSEK